MRSDERSPWMTPALLETVLSDMGEGVVVLDDELRVRLWNKAIEELSGVPAEEVLGKPELELFPFLVEAGTAEHYRRVLDGETIHTEPYPFKIPTTGIEGWVRDTYTPLRDDAGGVIGVIAIVYDLTEQVATIRELEESRAFLRSVVDSITEGVDVYDRDQNTLLWNQYNAKHSGISVQEAEGERAEKHSPEFFGPDPPFPFQEVHARVMAGETVEIPEWMNRPRGGKALDTVRSVFSPQRDAAGEIVGMVCAHKVITEQKKARDELKASEEFLRTVLSDIGEGVMVLDRDLKVQFWNKAIEALSGLPSAEVIGRSNPEMFPFLVDAGVPALYRRALAGETVHTEPFRFQVQSSGKEGWVRETYTPLRDGEGQIIGLISIVHDLTEQRKARDDLKASEEFLRTVLSDVGEGIIILDRDLRIRLWNKKMEAVSGMPAEDVVGEPILETFSFLVDAGFPAYYERSMAGETVQTDTFAYHVASTGRMGWAQEVQTPLRDEEGNITGIIEIVRDLTVQKEAEDALRRSERFLRTVLDSLEDGVSVMDRDNRSLLVNRAILDWTSFDVDTVRGRTWAEVIQPLKEHPDNQEARRLALAGETATVTRKMVNPGRPAETKWVKSVYRPHRNEHDDIVGVLAVHRDIHDQHEADEALRKSKEQLHALVAHVEEVREEEQRRLARELHDELGQAMTALKIDLDWMRRNRDGATGVEERIGSMSEIVEDLLARTRALTAQLRPKVLDDLGLIAAVEWFTRDFEARNGISCDLSVEPHDLQLDGARATALYRILQEALTNVARHAEAASVEIRIRQAARACHLVITDDGRGMSEADQQKAQSFGLMGIRERLVPFGGDLTIDSNPAEGTRLTVRLPDQDEGA